MQNRFLSVTTGRAIKARARRGFTLTELAITLGVIGLVLGAIWVAAGRAYNNQKTEKATQEIQEIIAGYRSVYAQRGIDVPPGGSAAGWNDVTCAGIDGNVFPTDIVPAATVTACAASPTASPAAYPRAPWNGSVIEAYTYQPNNTILIEIVGLSQTACVDYATAIYNPADLLYQSIYNGSTWVAYQWFPPYGTATTPWTPANIATYCGANNNNIVQIGVTGR